MLQLVPQQVCEEVVVTVPIPLLVQWDEEEVHPLQLLQGFLASAPPCHCLAQPGVHPVQDRSIEEKPRELGVLSGEYLLDKVF